MFVVTGENANRLFEMSNLPGLNLLEVRSALVSHPIIQLHEPVVRFVATPEVETNNVESRKSGVHERF